VLDHFGTPCPVGRYAGRIDEVFEERRHDVAAVAERPNVCHVYWNAMQRLAVQYSETEQHALFAGTARRVYRV